MLSFLKKIFGAKTTESAAAPVPYKVEKPESKVAEFPFPTAETKKKPAVKKPVAKAKPARKPRAPKV